jgi:hypothetical protein
MNDHDLLVQALVDIAWIKIAVLALYPAIGGLYLLRLKK